MQMHARIEVRPGIGVEHHTECDKDHDVRLIHFTVTSEAGGRGEGEEQSCLLFEMEDTAQYAIADAYESSDYMDFISLDDDDARNAAVDLATLADGLEVHDKSTAYFTV